VIVSARTLERYLARQIYSAVGFVLFGFLAAATRRVELVTGILILPQRQTALVAKQAASVDILSGGRLRLGVGVGWNAVEFEALGESFKNRGRRIEEQIDVMRALWTKELITFEGQWHRIPDAGINPLPNRRPIPVWMGGESDVVVKRAARMADGWMPHFRPGAEAQAIVDRQRHFLEHGEVAMRPLVLREIADTLDLHESTVSRVTTQKYMHTPRGILELKYFFGSHVTTEAGGAASSTAIRALIKQLVAAENARRPLSDGQISEILSQQGIMIARRTVAKYRESLQILPANMRKSL